MKPKQTSQLRGRIPPRQKDAPRHWCPPRATFCRARVKAAIWLAGARKPELDECVARKKAGGRKREDNTQENMMNDDDDDADDGDDDDDNGGGGGGE